MNKKLGFFGIALIVIVLVWLLFFSGDKESLYDTAIATRGNLIEEVNVTGRVKPSESVDLAFEKAGKISGIFVDVGDRIAYGSVMARLENSDVVAQLAQARANVKIQEAKLSELNRGYRDEEIEVQRIKVSNAKISLNEKEVNVLNTLRDAYTKSDDAIRNKIDQFISNPQGSAPIVNFVISNTSLKSNIEQGRVYVQSVLVAWSDMLILLNVNDINTTKSNLFAIRDFLNNVALAVNTTSPSVTLTQSTIDAYKTDVSTARTNVNTAISNLSTSEENYNNAKSALTLAEQELKLMESGTIEEKIIAQEGMVEEARASVRNYEAQLSKTVMYSPISGVVAKQDGKVGEITTAGKSIISINSASEFEIEVDIPEADIAKVAVSNVAKVTLDAYGDEVEFIANVISIEPAETIIEGVATYTTILQFSEYDNRIKSGMTANIDILTGTREDVIYVPSRSVITKDSKKIVRVVKGDSYEEVVVESGLRGSDGNIEIISGISEGDEVIIFIK